MAGNGTPPRLETNITRVGIDITRGGKPRLITTTRNPRRIVATIETVITHQIDTTQADIHQQGTDPTNRSCLSGNTEGSMQGITRTTKGAIMWKNHHRGSVTMIGHITATRATISIRSRARDMGIGTTTTDRTGPNNIADRLQTSITRTPAARTGDKRVVAIHDPGKCQPPDGANNCVKMII